MTKVIFILSFIVLISCTNQEENASKDEVIKVKEAKPSAKQIPDGTFVQKYPNGTVQIKGEMRHNKREGLWVAYYQNSLKQSESTYQNGVLHGKTASFYPNGQVRYIGYFLGGKKDGKWEFYTEEGKFEKSELYVKGELSK